MPERVQVIFKKVKAVSFIKRALCPTCGEELVFSNRVLASYPPIYPHTCPKCNTTHNLDKSYLMLSLRKRKEMDMSKKLARITKGSSLDRRLKKWLRGKIDDCTEEAYQLECLSETYFDVLDKLDIKGVIDPALLLKMGCSVGKKK